MDFSQTMNADLKFGNEADYSQVKALRKGRTLPKSLQLSAILAIYVRGWRD